MNRLYTTLLFFFTLLCSISAQSNRVIITFDHKFGPNYLKAGQSILTIWNDKKVKINRAQFYLSELELRQANGTSLALTNQYLLVNAANTSQEYDLGNWPVENINGLKLHVGVPENINHLDPSTYPANHALAMQNPSMHWGWFSGYRFIAVEGKVDNDGDGIPESAFEIHSIGDALYRSLELAGVKEAENGVLRLHFILDYLQLFKNLDMTGNLLQHGAEPINVVMMDNIATPQFMRLEGTTSAENIAGNSLRVSAAPNPFSSETVIEYDLDRPGELQLRISNSLGQLLRSEDYLPAKGSFRFEKATLVPGIYHCMFYQDGTLLARKKLIINR